MNPFKEHCGHDIEIKKQAVTIGDNELGTAYAVVCKDCEEEIISDEVFK